MPCIPAVVGLMNYEDLLRQVDSLRDRLSRLSEARRIAPGEKARVVTG